jgi:hypothetical protein
MDLYKCGGTPYALVYVKESHLPNVNYQYHTKFSFESENLLELSHEKLKPTGNEYARLIPEGIRKVLIS